VCTRQRGVTLAYTRRPGETLTYTSQRRVTLAYARRPWATLSLDGRPRVTLTSGGRWATSRYAFQTSLQHAFRPIHAAHRTVASLKGCPRGGYVVLLALQARFRPRVTLA
jgi:hypothetical protein